MIISVAISCRRRVRQDGLEQIVGASIMQEEPALSDAPQRRATEHIARSLALRDVIGQALAHVVDEQVAVEMDGQVFQPFGLALRRSHHGGCVAQHAANARA